MEIRKLLIAEGAEDFRLALADALKGVYHIRISREGQETLDLLRTFKPDLMLLDLMLPGLDGISLLQQAEEEGILPVVLATTRYVSDYVMETIAQLHVGYIMMKPCDVGATIRRLADLSRRIHQPMPTRPDPETNISNILLALGVPTKLRGYTHLREAVLLMAEKPGQAITKELYPAVALRCNCDATHVERSARSAILAAWQHRDEQIWRLYFPPDSDGKFPRPTNAAFITRLAELIRKPAESEDHSF